VLKDRVALDALEEVAGERQVRGVGGDVDSRDGEEIEIHVPGDGLAAASDVQIPSAEREVLRFRWIEDERRRRLQKTQQSGTPASRASLAISLREIHR
jgi:hypothetical protein